MSPRASCSSICHAIAYTTSVSSLNGFLGPEVSGPKITQLGWRQRRKAGLLDVVRLRESFAHVAMHGDELPLFFYSDLFIKHPETRELFPVSMAAQRGHLVDALVKIVSQVDKVDELSARSFRDWAVIIASSALSPSTMKPWAPKR